MHYNPNVLEAFNSIEHIMRDVNNGWLLRYLHCNTASAFFFLVYLHIGRGMYYGSYKAPRTLVWIIGTIMLIIMMATAFLGSLDGPKWFKFNKTIKITTIHIFIIIRETYNVFLISFSTSIYLNAAFWDKSLKKTFSYIRLKIHSIYF